MSEALESRLHELRQQARLYAEAHSKRIYLEHFRKSKLAILMKRLAKEQRLETVNAQEREALAHPEYLEVLEGLREATEIAERYGWELKIAMQGSSLWQTQQATLRAELKALGTKEA